MTNFTYANNFQLTSSQLASYVNALKHHRNRKKFSDRGFTHTDAMAETLIFALADNNCEFDPKDKQMCAILEELIRHGGYDEDGHYSQNAHNAIRNLYKKQNIPAENIKLADIPLTIKEKMRRKIKSIGQKISNFNNKVSQVFAFITPKIISYRRPYGPYAYQFYENSRHTSKHKQHGIKKWLQKNTKYILGGITIAGILGFGAKMSNEQSSEKIKYTPQTTTITPRDIKENITQQKSIEFSAPQIKTETTKENISNQVTQENKRAAILQNYYNTSLDILLGEKKKNTIIANIQKQIDNNIFKLEQGISVERFAHAYVMSNIYEGKSIIHNSLNTTESLSPNQQQQLTRHILEIGEKGEKLQHRASQKGKLSNHNKFSSASKTLQQAHITNLKQLKQFKSQHGK